MAVPLSRTIERRLVRACVIVSVIAGGLVVAVVELNTTPGRGVTRGQNTVLAAIQFVVLFVVLYFVGRRRAHRMVAPIVAWYDEGRVPSAAERVATLRLPWRTSVFLFQIWVIVAAVTSLATVVFSHEYRHGFGAAVATLLGGLTSCALAYLFAEREMRPILALALAGNAPDEPAMVPLRSRLLLAWSLGSGIPLTILVLLPALREHNVGIPFSVPVVVLGIAGLVGGATLVSNAARNVVEPLERIQDALVRVAGGDLDTVLPVDDGGELGMVQGHFNRMVEGLRERERMRDLFGRHVGTDVAAEALRRGVTLGGEVRTVSVFFVDLVGSTKLARSTNATEVMAVLNRFFSAVVDAATAAGGWVDKFEGDGALCVFGAPVPQDDHSIRALTAGRRLGAALRDLGIDAGIGLACGSVVAGNVGTEQRLEYTVIGDPVNQAARLTDLAKLRPSRVLATAEIVAGGRPEESRHWHSAGAVELRGVDSPVPVCEPAA